MRIQKADGQMEFRCDDLDREHEIRIVRKDNRHLVVSTEAVGQSSLMLIPDHLKNEETEMISRVRGGDRVASYETTRRRKDGARTSLQHSAP